MERVLIIGGNGCGKTTLAQKLAKKLVLPLIHLDVLYWRNNWENALNDERD
jgi:adenylate kinase family enzyme